MIRSCFRALLAAALLLPAPGPVAADEDLLFVYSENYYPTLDPAHHHPLRMNDERLLLALYEPLTRLDPATGEAAPALAERWEVSGDGRTWTFHLRADAKWSDGSPVTAKDLLRGWRRVLDPFTGSPWGPLFRPIQGCAEISDNSARTEGFSRLREHLEELVRANPGGIPGKLLNEMLDQTGVRPYLVHIRSRAVSRLRDWPDADAFQPEAVEKALDALKDERKRVRDLYRDAFEAFGSAASGAHAASDRTLVVRTAGDVPFLPELLARAAFVPLHQCVDQLRALAFEVVGYVGNGPFRLKGRGAKPPAGQAGTQRVLSVVELDRNPHYQGPWKARVDRVMCYTDQGLAEDLHGFKQGRLHWVLGTWPEFPPTDKKDPAKDLRQQIEATPGYLVRETPSVLFLRLRADREPFKRRAARLAFARSVDRQAVAAKVWPAGRPTLRLVPEGITGRLEGVAAPDTDVGAAKAAFKEAGLGPDTWVEVSFGEAAGQSDVVRDALTPTWKQHLGLEPSWNIVVDSEQQATLRAGAYYAMVAAVRGWGDDPYTYVASLHGDDPDSGLGWRDEAFNALLDAAREPAEALADPAGFAARVGQPTLQAALEAARAGGEARERLRRELLAAAERRILEEAVIVPLVTLPRAELLQPAVRGLGEPAAWRNPAFVGSLCTVAIR